MDDFLTRGREFRRELVALLAASGIDGAVGGPRPIGGTRGGGMVSAGASWVTEQLLQGPRHALKTLDRASPLLDMVFGAMLEPLEALGDPDRWFVPAPPHVMVAGRSQRLRIGVFTWATDPDAFAGALLGRPVPRHPRYAPTGPTEALHLDHGEALEWAEVWGVDPSVTGTLWGLGVESAGQESAALMPAVRRAGGDDRAASGFFAAVAGRDPAAFARSPFGRLLLPIARGAPGWRKGPDVEWMWAADVGVFGSAGIAWWIPGDPSLRRHRSAYAAHLRFLFDYHVAPWRRHKDPRAQREAFLIHQAPRAAALAMPGARAKIRQLADFARRTWPESYTAEQPEVTLRRMYRLSRADRAGPHR